MYDVVVDWAPAYELVASLRAFAARSDQRTMVQGREWARAVRRRIDPDLARDLLRPHRLDGLEYIDLLIRHASQRKTVAEFLTWLTAASTGELYEMLAPYLTARPGKAPVDIAALRASFLELLTVWNQQYFSTIDSRILDGLQADAARQRDRYTPEAAVEFVEQVTNGIYNLPDPPVDTVLLVPQYHFRPWNIFSFHRGLEVIAYSSDALPTAPGEPDPAAIRALQALGDDSRLRILRFLAGGERSFTEVAAFSGLARSTTHHHLVTLRAAGMVRVHFRGEKTSNYSLRLEALERLTAELRSYLVPVGVAA